MSEIKAFPIREDEALKASPFFSQEVFDALNKGLPLTAFVAVKDSEAMGAVAGAIDGHIFEIWSTLIRNTEGREQAQF